MGFPLSESEMSSPPSDLEMNSPSFDSQMSSPLSDPMMSSLSFDTNTSYPSSSNVSRDKCFKYDVFISFRGEDTRRNFTDHLHAAFYRSGIFPFRDDEELRRGETINDQLIKAIEDSRSAVVVLSPNYASSSWCLGELMKILECKKLLGQIVVPIFYNVEPTNVRHQKGGFGAAFNELVENQVDPVTVQRWREALTMVANLSGQDSMNFHEATLVERIVSDIHTKLGLNFSGIPSKLVGIKERVHEVEEALDIKSEGLRSVGIVGMGGIGKTTLAWVVYERMVHLFNAGSFLENVRDVFEKEGMVFLQKRLLCQAGGCERITSFHNAFEGVRLIRSRMRHSKVFIVLDDVDDISQVEYLVGDLHWFGPGSRIIITSRNKRMLNKVDHVHIVSPLSPDHALALFKENAFGASQFTAHELEKLCPMLCRRYDGHPLALKLVGQAFADRSESEWYRDQDELLRAPIREILDRLRISYVSLDETAKKVFHYTACMFQGKKESYVEEVLSYLGLHPKVTLKVLKDRSLVYVTDGFIRVHYLISLLSRNSIHRDSLREPESQQMIISTTQWGDVLNEDMGSEVTEGLHVRYYEGQAHPTWCSLRAISKLTKLRFLSVRGDRIEYQGELKSLSNEMIYLLWESYPWESLPQGFQPCDIRAVILSSSCIRMLWDYSQCFGQLEELDLRDSKNLLLIPDLSNLPNLAILILQGCTNLFEVRCTTALHSKLVMIDLKGCTCLRLIPKAIEFPRLHDFVLSGCSSLEVFPEISGRMERLNNLNLDEMAMSELPVSINLLSGLKVLTACNCLKLQKLPSTLEELESLEKLDLSGCSSLREIPEKLRRLSGLTEINWTARRITEFKSLWRQLEVVRPWLDYRLTSILVPLLLFLFVKFCL